MSPPATPQTRGMPGDKVYAEEEKDERHEDQVTAAEGLFFPLAVETLG